MKRIVYWSAKALENCLYIPRGSSSAIMGKFPPEPTSESSSHSAHCHCGAVRFSFTLSPPLHEYPANSCNCSICTKNGYLIVYPWLKDFKLESGKDMLKNHMFGLKRTEHQFCSNCGSSCLLHIVEEGAPPIIGVNVGCIRWKLPMTLLIGWILASNAHGFWYWETESQQDGREVFVGRVPTRKWNLRIPRLEFRGLSRSIRGYLISNRPFSSLSHRMCGQGTSLMLESGRLHVVM